MTLLRRLAADPFVLCLLALAATGCDAEVPLAETARGCVKCAPPPELPPNHCTDRPILDVAGQLDPTSEDVSADLQAAIEFATLNGWATGLSAGTYRLARPLELPEGAHFIGSGPDTILAASTAPGTWAHDEALIEIVGVDGVVICDMTLDHQGEKRVENDEHLSFTMLISNASNNRVDGLVFRNPGASSKAVTIAAGPAVLILAREDGDAPYHAQGDVGELGSANQNVIANNRFEIDPWVTVAFAMRLYSDSSERRDWMKAKALVERNAVHGNLFVGDFYWNTLELTGAGTRSTDVASNQFDGHSLTHVDLDGGAVYNDVQKNEIVHAGKPAWLVGAWTPPDGGDPIVPFTAAIADHGVDADYRNIANRILHNRVTAVDALAPNPDEYLDSGAIVLEHAREGLVGGNEIDNVFGGTRGAAILLRDDTHPWFIYANDLGLAGGVFYGIRTSAWAEANSGTIEQNTIVANEGGIAFGNVWDGISGSSIYRNDVTVPATSPAPAISLEGGGHVAENVVDGGAHSIFASGSQISVYGNEAGGSSDYTYRVQGGGWLLDNAAYGTGSIGSSTPHCIRAPGAMFSESGNDFVCGQE